MLPLVQADGHQQGDGFRDAVAAREQVHALQAVDDEHSENGGGQNPAQIPHHLGRLLVLGREHHKGQEASDHGGHRAHGDGKEHLCGGHTPVSSFWLSAAVSSAFSMGLRRASRSTSIQPIAGSRKLPDPNSTRHTSGTARPMRAL